MKIDHILVNDMKASGHYFAAGALARSLKQDCNYGCHFGMRSTRDFAASEFKRGWEAKGA
jgi:hypothetical protein